MRRVLLKSKIHNARVTQANLDYEGSITLDEHLMESADIIEYERVQVVNCNTGARFETYVMKGAKGSGIIGLNGPAARLGQENDTVHILSYVILAKNESKNYKPILLTLNEKNEIIQKK